LGILGITYIIFNHLTKPFNTGNYLGTVIFLEILFVGIATHKRDNQPIYKIIYRGILFFFGKKEQRSTQIDARFTDFKIQDDHIIAKKTISKVFLINPYDISALNEMDTINFFSRVKQALHILPSQLQIIVRKETMKPDDINDHLESIYKTLRKPKNQSTNQSNKKREELIQQYSHDLKESIATGGYQVIRQYGVFAQDIDTNNVKQKIEAIGRLEDMYKRFDHIIINCGVSTKRLTNIELVTFMRKVLQ
jgi:hypothetical protein